MRGLFANVFAALSAAGMFNTIIYQDSVGQLDDPTDRSRLHELRCFASTDGRSRFARCGSASITLTVPSSIKDASGGFRIDMLGKRPFA
jgi:hypothetical protein